MKERRVGPARRDQFWADSCLSRPISNMCSAVESDISRASTRVRATSSGATQPEASMRFQYDLKRRFTTSSGVST